MSIAVVLRHRFDRLPSALRAGFWIVCAGATFLIMMSIARHLGGSLHILEVVFWRAAFGVVFMVPWFLRRGPTALRTEKALGHLGRTLLNYGGLFCIFYAATLIPLADITAIGFTRHLVRPQGLLGLPAPAHGGDFLGDIQQLEPDPPGLQHVKQQAAVMARGRFIALQHRQDLRRALFDDAAELHVQGMHHVGGITRRLGVQVLRAGYVLQ